MIVWKLAKRTRFPKEAKILDFQRNACGDLIVQAFPFLSNHLHLLLLYLFFHTHHLHLHFTRPNPHWWTLHSYLCNICWGPIEKKENKYYFFTQIFVSNEEDEKENGGEKMEGKREGKRGFNYCFLFVWFHTSIDLNIMLKSWSLQCYYSQWLGFLVIFLLKLLAI